MSSVSLAHIYKRFEGNVTAVADFTLDIEDKEFIILVGPSGCGKSTALRMIAGLEEISEGELLIDGVRVNDLPPKDRDIAMVFQNYALYPHKTVFENMAFGLRLRKIPREQVRERVEEAAEILGITHLLDRRPKALSGGQRQRVALGRAIVRQPKVFLLDEPLSNLDAKLRAQMRTELSRLHQKLGTTFIYVTHDQVEAMTMGTRIVVMRDGFIQQIDTPRNLYAHPANLFVATFMGSPQMNTVSAELLEKNNERYLRIGGTQLAMGAAGRASELASYVGQSVIVGIRPEDIRGDAAYLADHPETALEAGVEVVERMGAESYLHVEHEGVNLTLRVPGDSEFSAGDKIQVAFDMDRVHIFDEKTEKTIIG